MIPTSAIYLGILLLVGICLVSTIIIELLFALIFRVRGRNLLIVLLAQIVTNPLVVLVSNYISYSGDNPRIFLACLAVLEVVAVIVEGMIYKYFFRGYKFLNPYVLSLLLNFLSALTGVVALLILAIGQ